MEKLRGGHICEVDSRGSINHSLRAALLILCMLAAAALGMWWWLFSTGGRENVDFGQTVAVGQTPGDERQVLRVAVAAMISPEATRRYYYDMVELIGDRLGMRTTFIQRRTYAEVNKLVEDREVDVAFVCAGPYVEGHDGFGMEILAVPVVDGKKVYHSYIISADDSKITSFSDLRGKRFAFTDPDSNSGCLVPRYMLSRMDETPETFFSETFFTHSHDNSIRAVSQGQADGAAVDSLIYDFLKQNEPHITAGTVVVEESPPYGIPPIVTYPDLDPVLKARITGLLYGLREDPKGRDILDHLRIERFEPGDDKAYGEVRAMRKWLGESGT